MKIKEIIRLTSSDTKVKVCHIEKHGICTEHEEDDFYYTDCEYWNEEDGCEGCEQRKEVPFEWCDFEGTADTVPIKMADKTIIEVQLEIIDKYRRKKVIESAPVLKIIVKGLNDRGIE